MTDWKAGDIGTIKVGHAKFNGGLENVFRVDVVIKEVIAPRGAEKLSRLRVVPVSGDNEVVLIESRVNRRTTPKFFESLDPEAMLTVDGDKMERDDYSRFIRDDSLPPCESSDDCPPILLIHDWYGSRCAACDNERKASE